MELNWMDGIANVTTSWIQLTIGACFGIEFLPKTSIFGSKMA
jgi:hypothetical protein